MILKKGANIEAITKKGGTVLHDAVIYKRENIISLFLKYGANIDSRNFHGETPLCSAVATFEPKFEPNISSRVTKSTHKERAIAILLENGADIDAADMQGKSPVLRLKAATCG